MRLLGDDGTAPAALRLERFRWRTVASAVALTVAAYLLIGEVSGVDVLGTLGQANPGWLAVAVLASAVTYQGAAIGIAAIIPQRLSIWRGFFVPAAPTVTRQNDCRPSSLPSAPLSRRHSLTSTPIVAACRRWTSSVKTRGCRLPASRPTRTLTCEGVTTRARTPVSTVTVVPAPVKKVKGLRGGVWSRPAAVVVRS
jgi:hypothetical protein